MKLGTTLGLNRSVAQSVPYAAQSPRPARQTARHSAPTPMSRQTESAAAQGTPCSEQRSPISPGCGSGQQYE